MYVLVKTNVYNHKNKLQEAVQFYLESQDRMIFATSEDVAKHRQKVVDHIEYLNGEYTRCTSISLSGWSSYQKHEADARLSVYGLIDMSYFYGKDEKS